jgi:hypothetical protein
VIIDDGFLDGGDVVFATQVVYTGDFYRQFKGGRYVIHSDLNYYNNIGNHFEYIRIGISGIYPEAYKPFANYGYKFYVNYFDTDDNFRFLEFDYISSSSLGLAMKNYDKKKNLFLGSAVNKYRKAKVRFNEIALNEAGFYNGNKMYSGSENATDYELIYFGNVGNCVFKSDGIKVIRILSECSSLKVICRSFYFRGRRGLLKLVIMS